MPGPWTPNRLALAAALAVVTLAASALRAQSRVSLAVDDVMDRIGARVGEYFRRAESIVCIERVTVQPIRADMSAEGFARVLEYELRASWEEADDGGAPEAKIVRQLRKINGRAARPDAEPKCMDPKAVSPEPLAFLLPSKRHEYMFEVAGPGRDKNRDALILTYKSRAFGKAEVTHKDDCTNIELPGWMKGRIWADPDTSDVLRLEERLARRFDFRTPLDRLRYTGGGDIAVLERADTSIRYRPVTFTDPNEIVLLPESIESLTLVRGGGRIGNRTVQTFSGYKRFVTGGRLVK
jgi:hypothetical protein